MKKIVSLLLLCCMVMTPCFAEKETIYPVYFDGEIMTFDQNPMMVEDRILVPMRAIFEALGAEVNWIEETQTVVAKKDDKEVSLTIDAKELYVNGAVAVTLDVPARLVGSRTLVPLRAISQVFDCHVEWDEQTESVKILSDQVGFSVKVSQHNVSDALWAECLEKYQAMSDAPIEWMVGNVAGGEPSVILKNHLTTAQVSTYAAEGYLLPLDPYITPENTPNIWKMFEERPKTKAANYLPDGHMYSMPQVIEFEPNFLERAVFINKTWLDKLGLAIPTTTEELQAVLQAFKTQDPNGNGKADEIPLTFSKGHAFSCPEAMLSAWGYSTKSGTYDSYCTVKDGQVYFAPTLDAWKEMVKFYRDLYADGLIDANVFHHAHGEFDANLNQETSIVGMVWSKTCPMKNADEYVGIAPIHAEGIDPVWHIHPGIIGQRNMFSITKDCKNPEAAMRWIDKFYELENGLESEYGVLGYALNEKNQDGVYTWNQPPADQSLATFIDVHRPMTAVPCYLPGEIFGTTLEKNSTMIQQEEIYELYRNHITQEPWPRPYYSVEESATISGLQSAIFKLVDDKMEAWVTGTEDIETGWEPYLEELDDLGLDTLMDINKTAYQRFLDAMN